MSLNGAHRYPQCIGYLLMPEAGDIAHDKHLAALEGQLIKCLLYGLLQVVLLQVVLWIAPLAFQESQAVVVNLYEQGKLGITAITLSEQVHRTGKDGTKEEPLYPVTPFHFSSSLPHLLEGFSHDILCITIVTSDATRIEEEFRIGAPKDIVKDLRIVCFQCIG